MSDLGETLLALVHEELWPVDQVLVNLFIARVVAELLVSAEIQVALGTSGRAAYLLERLGVVPRQLDTLPHLARQMCSLDRLHVEIHLACKRNDSGESEQKFATGTSSARSWLF